ncbi:hypothetical protein MAR_008052 [Mya arenaria]|uniref:Uncharacterized protein n=1 Tax=Mya arenaria TaxID=6604 RepID=A0ABY7DWS6_MYAAR|nr:hypothetical protein MAR_008052 [Mya arenaria]
MRINQRCALTKTPIYQGRPLRRALTRDTYKTRNAHLSETRIYQRRALTRDAHYQRRPLTRDAH